MSALMDGLTQGNYSKLKNRAKATSAGVAGASVPVKKKTKIQSAMTEPAPTVDTNTTKQKAKRKKPPFKRVEKRIEENDFEKWKVLDAAQTKRLDAEEKAYYAED